MKGVLSWLERWACRAGTRDFWFCFGCSSRPSKKYNFPNLYYFNAFFPIAQQAGQATVMGRLSFSVCLWGPES
jgi:hypothetical protein